jgi:predicted transposase YbfD/YdcC
LPKKTFECAEVVGATFITQAKDNQTSLKNQLEHGCNVQPPIHQHTDVIDKAHGRLEQRTYEVFQAMPMLKKWQKDWPYIRQVVRVTRYRHELNRQDKGPSLTTHYYVSNSILTAEQYAKYIREHWWIENKVNNVKDVAFREDTQTKHCNPYIYSTCIDIALNIMRVNKEENIKNTLYRNSLDFFAMYEKIKNIC